MSRSRTERLVNLVLCLLSTRRFLTAAQIAATVPGYAHDPSDPRAHDAFQRKFERDKAELRALGVPLETGTDSVFDAEAGYRIARREYALPDIALAPDEAAVVGVAARLWQHAGLASAAWSGLTKLRAAGVEPDPGAGPGVEPVVTVDAALTPLVTAARQRRRVSFGYRVPHRDAPTMRRLEPWGVACWGGRWYVVGHDRDRGAPRCFRLSRVVGRVRPVGAAGAFTPPAGVDLLGYVTGGSAGTTPWRGRATVLLRAGRADGVRRCAERVTASGEGDIAVVGYRCADDLAAWLVGYGADVQVLDPPEVRDAVVTRLKELVHDPGGAPVLGSPADARQVVTRSRRPATRSPSYSAGSATARWLGRLLTLVPYLQARPGIRLARAAQELGVSEQQLRDDLRLLWVCGLPGYGPGDLIDMAFDGDRVTITYDAGMDRPLRLAPDEAVALVVALRVLAETPGVADREVIDRAIAKIEGTVGERLPVVVRLPGHTDRLREVRDAVARQRALTLTYYSASRDRTTERVVDPVRVVVADGHAYLAAWCRRAQGPRWFRVDRIDALVVRDEPAAPPAVSGPSGPGEFPADDDLPLVTLRLGRQARWVAEYYPCERVDDSGPEWLVSLRVADLSWARRLALRLGPDAAVVAPAGLVEEVRRHAEAAVAVYAAPATPVAMVAG